MGFNKRYFNEEILRAKVQNNMTFDKIFNVDCLLFEDDFSDKVHKLYLKGKNDGEIIEKMFNNIKK